MVSNRFSSSLSHFIASYSFTSYPSLFSLLCHLLSRLSSLAILCQLLRFSPISRKATLRAHPDKEGGSEKAMAALNEAYEVLSKPGSFFFSFPSPPFPPQPSRHPSSHPSPSPSTHPGTTSCKLTPQTQN